MSDAMEAADTATPVRSDPTNVLPSGSAAAGALLKKARESTGLHIAALAVSLKVPVSKLEALEQGRLEALSGPVFVRALASSVCRNLKLDPTPVLALLPLAQPSQLVQQPDLNAPFKGAGRTVQFSGGGASLGLPVVAVTALLLGAAVLFFLPQLREWTDSWAAESTRVETAVPLGGPLGGVVNGNLSDAKAPPSLPTVATSDATVPVPTPMPTPLANPTAAVVSTTSESKRPVSGASGTGASILVGASTSTMGTVPATAGVLTFKANGASWVEVSDAKGLVVLRKTLEVGETVPVNGTPPFKLVIGRVDATELWVRGQRFDLSTVANGNVAKFEVK
jgi:cytoskeleton protein RodZ